MGGHNTVVVHNTCEDSLLASPIILDLVILTEICQRITIKSGKTRRLIGVRNVSAGLRWAFDCTLQVLHSHSSTQALF